MDTVLLSGFKMATRSTLYSMCLNKIAELLKTTYWNLNCDRIDNPFLTLPTSIIDDLVTHVTRLSVVNPLRSSDLHLLLTTGRVRHFCLEDVGVSSEELEYIFMDLSSACENLLSVKLKNVFCNHTYRMNLKTYALERLLCGAPKLESVKSCIAFNLSVLSSCVNLKQLVLLFPVEDKLFDFLDVDGHMVPHNSLRVLDIYEDVRHPISYLDIAVILNYCTELVEINCDISKSLEYLHTEKLYNGTLDTKYKLQKCCLGSIYLDSEEASVTRDGVYIATLTCPEIREVDVLAKDYGAVSALSDFRHITSLLLQWEVLAGGEYHECILPLLRHPEFGRNLKSLHIIHFAFVDFSSIGATCPNLEELRVEHFSEKNLSPFTATSFQKLINVHVENMYDQNCDEKSIIGLLSNATDIKYVLIQAGGNFTDEVLEVIMKSNRLSKLKELRISNCVFTVRGLQTIARKLTSLEYFEMTSRDISLDTAAAIIHEINPRIIMSCIADT